MLRKFKIAIDGKEYLVEMEEIGGVPQAAAPAPAPVAAAPQAPAAPQAAEEAPAPAPSPVPADGKVSNSPMPGTIIKILVKEGDKVSVNQPIMVLEAMKMENEVVAEADGTIVALHVTQGQIVNAGEALFTQN